MAPNVQYLQGDTALSEDATRALIRVNLSHTRFDFVRISDLQTSAGRQSRRGKAEFRVFASGEPEFIVSASRCRHASHDLVVGFPGDRARRLEGEPDQSDLDPSGNLGLSLPGGLPKTDDSHLGFNDGIDIPRHNAKQFPALRRAGMRSRRSAGIVSDLQERN